MMCNSLKMIKYLVAIIVISILIYVLYNKKSSTMQGPVVGILHTTSHPAFDRDQDGIIDSLRATYGDKINFIINDAQGSMANAHAMAYSMHNNDAVVAICTIGTLATQAVMQIEKKKPIILSAVSVPDTLGVSYAGTNVCGVSDLTDVDTLVQTMRMLLPDARTIATLYCPAETNSVVVINKIETLLHVNGLSLIRIGVNNESEVVHATQKAISSADAIIIPCDNTIASTISIVAKCAMDAKIPVIAAWPDAITPGILVSAGGSDYYELGKHTGQIVIDILQKKQSPEAIAIKYPTSSKIVMHKQTVELLGIKIPPNLLQHIEWMGV